MFHRTRSLLVLVVILAFFVTACIPPELGAFVMGCSLVQGNILVPAAAVAGVPLGGLTFPAIQVQDMAGNILGSGTVRFAPADVDNVMFSLDIPVNPPQPEGTFLLLVAEGGGPLGGAPCTAAPVPTFFNPGDGRVDPRPGDRLAIYCNQPPGSLDVWGVDDESEGFRLATFPFDELIGAGPTGVYTTVNPNGTISVSMDEQGNMWAAWNGGVHGADGQPDHGFAKGFRCD